MTFSDQFCCKTFHNPVTKTHSLGNLEFNQYQTWALSDILLIQNEPFKEKLLSVRDGSL